MDNFLATLIDRPNCELIKNSFQWQPINFITNIAFFVTSFALYRLFQKHRINDISFRFMFLLSILLGVGSALNHTIPNNLTLLLDGAPVYALVFVGLVIFSRTLFRVSSKQAVAYTIFFFLVQIIISLFIKTPFDASILFYIVNLLAFVPIAIFTYLKLGYGNTRNLILALTFYGLAIGALLLDEMKCQELPFGTHFLWHIFVALALYWFVAFLVRIRFKNKV